MSTMAVVAVKRRSRKMTVNGQRKEWKEGLTVAALLEREKDDK